MDLFLSDLHLGSPLFDSERELISLTGDKRFKRIFFVGDTIDVWEDDFYSIRQKFDIFVSHINQLIREGKEVHIIRGNHDPDEMMLKYAWPQAKVHKTKYIEDDMIVVHGNEFDGAILKVEFINKLLYYFFIHPLIRFFNYDIRHKFQKMLSSVAARRDKSHYDKLVSQIEKDAVEKYQDKYNSIVMGHTHCPKVVDCSDGECHCDYINCGDWIHNKSYVIRNNKGEFKLIHGEELDDVKFSLEGESSGD